MMKERKIKNISYSQALQKIYAMHLQQRQAYQQAIPKESPKAVKKSITPIGVCKANRQHFQKAIQDLTLNKSQQKIMHNLQDNKSIYHHRESLDRKHKNTLSPVGAKTININHTFKHAFLLTHSKKMLNCREQSKLRNTFIEKNIFQHLHRYQKRNKFQVRLDGLKTTIFRSQKQQSNKMQEIKRRTQHRSLHQGEYIEKLIKKRTNVPVIHPPYEDILQPWVIDQQFS